jgi:hypothetical protein
MIRRISKEPSLSPLHRQNGRWGQNTAYAQAAIGERAKELTPEAFCFRWHDVDAQNLSASVGVDRNGDYWAIEFNAVNAKAGVEVGGASPTCRANKRTTLYRG